MRGSRPRSVEVIRSCGGALAAVGMLLLGAGCAGGEAAPTSTGPTSADPRGGAAGTAPPEVDDPRRSEGCGVEPEVEPVDEDVPGDVPLTFAGDAGDRAYRLAVPAPDEPEPAPLILNLHGAGSNALQQSIYSQLPARGAERGYLVVTPQAVDGMWELAGEGPDDRFLTALLDEVAAEHCVDLDRIHAAGISLGAWKATVTACTHPERFASLALVAEEVAPPDCAMSVVAFHGTADSVVPYGAGADEGVVVTGANAGLPGVEVNLPAWARNAGCSPEKDVERIEPDVEHWVYRDCSDGLGVELYSILGGGHTWPGSPIEFPGTTTTIDATQIALDWFDVHPRPG